MGTNRERGRNHRWTRMGWEWEGGKDEVLENLKPEMRRGIERGMGGAYRQALLGGSHEWEGMFEQEVRRR